MNVNQNITTVNKTVKNDTSRIKYIVMHYTGNNGDTALSNTNYFKSVNRCASAHYFVDDKEIWQCVADGDIAWHCGTKGTYYHKYCRNPNSIGIELCSKVSNGQYYFLDNTITQAIQLVNQLMTKYNIPIENVIRHYDVTHKLCPEPFVKSETAWSNFKNQLVNKMEVDNMSEIEKLRADFDEQVKYYNDIINAVGAELEALKNANLKRYNYIDANMPEWARDDIKYLVDNKMLLGDDNGNLNLSDNDLRYFVVLARAMKK